MVVHTLLAQQAVHSHGQSVVGGEENVGIIHESFGFQVVQDFADLRVEVTDDGVVFLQVRFDGQLSAGEGRQCFVAQLGADADFVVPRVVGLETRRNLDAIQRVHINILLRRLPGVVGGVEGQVHEEWMVTLAGLPGEIRRVVGDYLSPMLAALPEAAFATVGRRP